VSQTELSEISNRLNGLFDGLNNPQIQAKKPGLSDLEKSISESILNIMKTEDEIEYEARIWMASNLFLTSRNLPMPVRPQHHWL